MKNIVKLIFFVSVITIQAQELSFYLATGNSGLKYSGIDNTKLKFGGNLGVGYTQRLNEKINIISGIGIGSYRNESNLNSFKQKKYLIDDRKSAFEYRVSVGSLNETSSSVFINIPIMFRLDANVGIPMYFGIGTKVFLPIEDQSVTLKANDLKATGYYPERNVLYDDLPKHGFGKLPEFTTEKKIKLQTAFSLSGEFGTIIKISPTLKLYLGGYLDYSLTDVRKHNDIEEGSFNFEYSSAGLKNLNFNDNLKVIKVSSYLLSYGVQLRYAFTVNKIKKEKVPFKDLYAETPKQSNVNNLSKQEIKIPIDNSNKNESELDLKSNVFFSGLFESSKSDVNTELQMVLDGVIDKFNMSEYNSILIETSTDSNEYNVILSKVRALNVYKYFVSKGVDPQKLSYKYDRQIKPVNSNDVLLDSDEYRKVIVTLK